MIFTNAKISFRHLVVVAMLLAITIFGKWFEQGENATSRLVILRQNEAEFINKGIHHIFPLSKPTIIDLKNSYKKGDSARLFLNIEAKDVFFPQPYERRPIDLSIYLRSDYGEDQLVDTLSLIVPDKIVLREIKFTSNFDSSKLMVKRNDSRTTGELTINNIQSFRLEPDGGVAGLAPTILGNTDISKIVYTTADKFMNRFPMIFTRKNQFFAQEFVTDSNRISTVDLALSWRESGGSGNYLLELKEAMPDGSYSDALAHYYFDKNTVKDSLIGKNIYRLPLAANLEDGKRYLISVNNSRVNFNIFNTLSIGSIATKNDSVAPAITWVGVNETKQIQPFFMRVNGAECAKINDSCLLHNSVIQDLGKGDGLYSYQSIEDPLAFLDLYKSDQGAIYDNSVGGLIAPTRGETSLYFKFDTIFPYKVMKILLDQSILNASKNEIFYSFDNANWNPIQQNEDGNLMIDRAIKPPSDRQSELYLKITYDHEDAAYKQSIYFGVKGIKVQAMLDLN